MFASAISIIQSICDAGDDTGGVADDGILTEFRHVYTISISGLSGQ